MNPSRCSHIKNRIYASVYYVFNSYFLRTTDDRHVNYTCAVRPVIYLKNQNIITENDELDKEFQRLKKLLKL